MGREQAHQEALAQKIRDHQQVAHQTQHHAEKVRADLAAAQARFDRQAQLIAEGSIPAPTDINTTPAALQLKDAKRAVEFLAQCSAMDETVGMAILKRDGFQLNAGFVGAVA